MGYQFFWWQQHIFSVVHNAFIVAGSHFAASLKGFALWQRLAQDRVPPKNQIRTQWLGTISLSGYGCFWASNACGSQSANLFAIIYLKRQAFSLASLSIIRTRPRSRRSSIWGRIKSGKRAEYFYFLRRDSGRSRFVPIFMPDKMRQECVRARSAAAGCALIILAPEGVDERAPCCVTQ